MRPLLAALLVASTLACSGESGPARRVVLISLDTLRADHLPMYGHDRDTAPVLGRMAAEEGVVFERCYAQASWTLPSHMSMLTGLYPLGHGVTGAEKRLSHDVVTLAERLSEAGFTTAAFTDGGYVSPGWGLEDGFDVYEDDQLDKGKAWGLKRILPHAEDWLRAHDSEDFFLFLHTYEVHAPYADAEPWTSHFRSGEPSTEEELAQIEYLRGLEESAPFELERFEDMRHVRDTYDGLIRRADDRVGRLFALMRELGMYDDALIIVTSDHGESLLDTDLYAGHGLLLTEAETRIPLLVKFPGNRFAGQRCDAMVESIDLAPTILHALRVSPGGWSGPGNDLARVITGEAEPRPHAFSVGAGLQVFAVRSTEWTLLGPVPAEASEKLLVERLKPADVELVRARMPLEPRLLPTGLLDAPNQCTDHPDVEALLREAYSDWQFSQFVRIHERGQPEERGALEEHELERLKALGYL